MARYVYHHMDVFTDVPLAGNGVAVVYADAKLMADEGLMLQLAREFKQFETIFLGEVNGGACPARIFTMDGELAFAGHPVLGAAASLHGQIAPDDATADLLFRLADKAVPVRSSRTAYGWLCAMRQGAPSFLGKAPRDQIDYFAAAHNLRPEDLHPSLPMEIVTTGLPYLLIPVRGPLADARITVRDLEPRLHALGADYSYLFNPDTLEARTWDNLGLIEDTATGSAAGPTCAYLAKHGRIAPGERITICQGDYAGHPGRLTAWMQDGEVFVEGGVVPFAQGRFDTGLDG